MNQPRLHALQLHKHTAQRQTAQHADAQHQKKRERLAVATWPLCCWLAARLLNPLLRNRTRHMLASDANAESTVPLIPSLALVPLPPVPPPLSDCKELHAYTHSAYVLITACINTVHEITQASPTHLPAAQLLLALYGGFCKV